MQLGNPHTYRIRVAARTVELSLRHRAGDFFVFHEVFTSRCYVIPEEWRGRIRTVVDLGAHIGLTTLFLLESLPDARIVCVEAAPDNARLLRSNLSAFGDRTQVVEAAIAAESGVAMFDRTGWSWGRSVHTAAADGVLVSCATIEDIVRRADIETIDLLKVDIEGAEADLFERDATWLNRVGAIVIELHHPYSLPRFARRVEDAGFKVVDPQEGRGNRMIMATRIRRTPYVKHLLN